MRRVPPGSWNFPKRLIPLEETSIGAGGGTRTHTTFYGPGILSPVRLPFRHTGTTSDQARPDSYRKVLNSRKRRVRGLWQRHGPSYASLTVADVPLSASGAWTNLGFVATLLQHEHD